MKSSLDLYVHKDKTKIERIIHSSIQDQLVSLYLVKDKNPESKVHADCQRGEFEF